MAIADKNRNWFFGFPIDGGFVTSLPDVPPAFRRFHPADVHLTLAFLGACGEEGAARALGALDRSLAGSPLAPVDVSLAEVVPMGPRGAYSALSALLACGREEAARYITSLRDVLTDAAGARREDRAAKPHVTIARPQRRAALADRAAGIAWASRLDLSAVTARLDRIALFTWSDRRDEQLFRIVSERSLG